MIVCFSDKSQMKPKQIHPMYMYNAILLKTFIKYKTIEIFNCLAKLWLSWTVYLLCNLHLKWSYLINCFRYM